MTEKITTPHLGAIEYVPEDIIELQGGMPGFSGLDRFLLVNSDELEPFKLLQSVDQPMLCFTLIPPQLVKSGYRVELSAPERAKLGLERAVDGLVYSIVTLADDPNKITVNLFAPLVINTANMRGAQVILVDSGYEVDEPLVMV